ncbi:MAG: NAD(P)/FAD-dependent oxidoreductase, partial [Thermoleophilaceae bacterium]|nr:NAD(P)/FAD-dependent oxidoreductase [Thermoleophilaceae bacterium]
LVERDLLGGECDYWACIPSKTLLRPGEALQAARDAPGAREAVNGGIDAAAAFGWRDFMTSGWDDSAKEAWPASKGIDVLRGTGSIAAPGRVAVDGSEHSCEHIVLATGSEAIVPPVPGLSELEGVWTNREVTALTEVPRRMLVLGAGPVGVEMAQAVSRMGASVALVEGMEHVLPREPKPLGVALGEALAAEGIELHFGQHASAARRDGDDYVLEFPDGNELRGDKLLVATGRRPRVDGIGLENVGIEPGRRGIEVDQRMNVAPGVWAIGDVTGIWPLTYVGKYQGRIAAANILGRAREASYEAVPRVVFTDPQAASVGEADGEVTVTVPISQVPRTATYTRAYAEKNGFLALVSDGGRLTGAYALGPEAGEWLQQATVAIRAKVPLKVMDDVIQPFPTFSEIFLHALTELGARVPAAA